MTLWLVGMSPLFSPVLCLIRFAILVMGSVMGSIVFAVASFAAAVMPIGLGGVPCKIHVRFYNSTSWASLRLLWHQAIAQGSIKRLASSFTVVMDLAQVQGVVGTTNNRAFHRTPF